MHLPFFWVDVKDPEMSWLRSTVNKLQLAQVETLRLLMLPHEPIAHYMKMMDDHVEAVQITEHEGRACGT